MDWATAFRNLQADPEFANLTYAEQVNARDQVFRAALAGGSELSTLSEGELNDVYKRTTFSAPSFKDPSIRAQIDAITAARDTNQPGAQNTYDAMVNRLGEVNGSSGLFLQLAGKVSGAVDAALTADDQKNPKYQVASLLNNPEAAKAYQWLNAREMVEGPRVTESAKMAHDVLNIEGNIGDFAATMGQATILGVTGKGIQMVGKEGAQIGLGTTFDLARNIPFIQAGIANSIKPIAQVAYRTFLPAAIEGAVVAGPMGLVIGKAISTVANDPSTDPFNSFESFAMNYGIGVASNAAAGLLFREVLPFVLGVGKHVFGAGIGVEKQTLRSPEEISKGINDLMSGKDIPDSLKAQLGPYQQALIGWRASMDEIHNTKPTDLTDEQRVFFGTELAFPDAIIGKTQSGGYTVFHAAKESPTVTNLVQRPAKTIYDVADTVARLSADRIEELQKAVADGTASPGDLMLAQKMREGAPWLETWHQTNVGASRAFDAAQGKPIPGYIKTEDRFYVGTNQVNGKIEGTQAIPVKMPVDDARLDRLRTGNGAVDYSDLRPMTPDDAGADGLLFITKALDVPTGEYERLGPGSIMGARVRGYDALRLINEDGTTRAYVPLTPSNLKVLVSQTDPRGKPAPQVRAQMQPAQVARTDMRAAVRGTVEAKLSTTRLGENTPLLTDFMATRFLGEVRPDDVRVAVGSLRGIEPSRVEVRLSAGGDVRVRTLDDGRVLVEGPTSLANPAQTAKFIRTITTQAGLPGAKVGEKLAPPSYAVLERMRRFEKPTSSVLEKIIGPRELQAMLKKELGVDLVANPDGTFGAMIRGTFVRGSLIDVYKAARPSLVPQKALQEQLSMLGAKIHRVGTKVTVEMPGQAVRTYDDLVGAAEANGVDTTLLPSTYRPAFIEIDPTSGQVDVYADRSTVRLGKRDAFDLFNSFASDDPLEAVKVVGRQGGFASLIERPQSIELIDHATKTKMFFPTVEAAREWAALDRSAYATYADQARLRGMRLDYNNGQYELRTGDATVPLYRVNAISDIPKVLESYDMSRMDATEMMPFGDDIVANLPDDLIREWKSLSKAFTPIVIPEHADYSVWTPSHKTAMMQNITNHFETFGTSLQRLVDHGDIPIIIQARTNTMIAGEDAFRGSYFQAQRLMQRIFSVGKRGKTEVGSKAEVLDDDRQRVVAMHLQAFGTEAQALEKAFPLTLAERRIVNNTRELTDRLADKFGIELVRRLPGYMTRIRRVAAADPKLMNDLRNGTTGNAMLSTLANHPHIDKNMIREMQPWFEKSRKQDMMLDIFEDRALPATLRYLQAGLRKVYLDVPGQEFLATFNAFEKQLPLRATQLLKNFYHQVLNTIDDANAEVAVRDTGREFAKGYGQRAAKGWQKEVVNLQRLRERLAGEGDVEGVREYDLLIEEAHKNIATYSSPVFAEEGAKLWDKGLELSYATMLGLKPMLAVRNTLGLYSMYAPAFGGSYLQDAIKMVTKAPKEQIAAWAERLMASNDIGTHQALVVGQQLQGVARKYADVSLKWFGQGDTYTRLVGYLAATSRFGDAADKLARGVFGGIDDPLARSRFERYSGMDVFSTTNRPMADRVWQEVQAGVADGGRLGDDGLTYTSTHSQIANDIFAKEVVRTTLFNYASYNKPMIFNKGLFGRLFGMLGMFPASYRGYLAQMGRNLTKGRMAAFALNFISTNLALMASFQLAGIRTNDFFPILPGLAGMGPSMEQAMNLVEATGQGPQAADAQRQLLGFLSPIVPDRERDEGTGRPIPGGDTVLRFNYPQVAPGSAQYYYLQKALSYADDGDWYAALLSLTTAQVESQSVDLEVPLPGGKLTIEGAHPRQLLQNLADQGGGLRR